MFSQSLESIINISVPLFRFFKERKDRTIAGFTKKTEKKFSNKYEIGPQIGNMFTGIVESQGKITKIETTGTNLNFWISSTITHELKVDQSISHDGVCLTVEEINGEGFRVSAIQETLQKTNLSHWATGKIVNLERAMILGARLDGHLVQGHVDTTATCISRENKDGSWLFRFKFPNRFAHLVIEKGSIAVNGTSLTAFDVTDEQFSVAIIPYTFNHTGIKDVEPGTLVNIEFDILGKYITRWKELDKNAD